MAGTRDLLLQRLTFRRFDKTLTGRFRKWADVHAGIRPGEEPLTQAFFEARGEVVLDARTGRHAGAYLARYGRSHGVQLGDALVAAAAATTGLRLWTLNRRHCPMKDIDFYEA